MTVGILPGFLTAGLAVQMGGEIGLTLTSLGVVVGVFFAASAVTSPAMGVLVQRVGWARALRAAATLAAVTLAGIASTVDSPGGLAGWFVLGGVACSLAAPAANLTVARCVPARRRGLLFGIKHAAVPAATFLGGIAVPAVALTVGWRWAFGGGAFLAVLTALLVPLRPSLHERTPVVSGPGRVGRPSTPLPLLVGLAIAAVLGIGGIDAMKTFIVTYAVETGMTESAAGYLLAGGSVAGIVTRVIAGWLIDRTDRADLTAVAAMQIVGALGVIVITAGAGPGLVFGGLVAFVAGWGWSGLLTFAVVKDNEDAPATATGITQTGVFVGAAIGPPAFGLLADHVSYRAAWWSTAMALLGAAALTLYVRRQRILARPT